MASFKWICVSYLLVLVGTEFTHEKCDSTDDKLYIVADLTTKEYTITAQVSDFLQVFQSKRKSTSKDLDIHLIEPFQEKLIQFDPYNNTVENSMSAIRDFLKSKTFNRSIHADYLDLSKALNYTEQVIRNDTSRSDHVKHYIIAAFFFCDLYCRKTAEWFQINTTFGAKQLMLFLSANHRESDPIFYNEKFVYVHIYKNLFNFTFNNILNLLCHTCPAGWLGFKEHKDIFNNTCYKVFRSNTSLNCFGAREHCEAENADLAVMETKEELKFVKKILHTYHLVHHEEDVIPVGLTNRENAMKRLQWINGRPFLVLTKNVSIRSCSNLYCGAFYYATENESKIVSDVGDDDITWVRDDCEIMNSRTVLCEKYIKNFIFFVNQTLPSNLSNLINQIVVKQNNEFHATISDPKIMYSILHVLLDFNMIFKKVNLLFDCRDGLKFIYYINVCDNKVDCLNGRDEINCDRWIDDRFIIKKNSCDNLQYIRHNKDYEGCDECMDRRCSDGTCVPRHWLSRDGETCSLYKATDGKMFLNASENCEENCNFIEQFIHEIVICNSNNGLKSSHVLLSNNLNMLSNFTWTPKCLYIRGRSGNPRGCSDMTHLNDCEHFECPETFFKCYKSYCISIYMMSDKITDCVHGEDEYTSLRGDFLFHCGGRSFLIIHPLHVCDGIAHCPLGDDELNCNFKCPRGFTCLGGAVVVGNYSEIGVIRSFDIFDHRSRYLNVSGIDLSNVKEAYVLPNLLDLQVTHCNISNVDLFLYNYYDHPIFSVNLSYNNILRLEKYGNLRYLNNLKSLSLGGNTHLSILDPGMFVFKLLHTLDVSFTNISILDFKDLQYSNSLRYLNICKSKINKILTGVSQAFYLDFLDIRQTLLQPENVIEFLKVIRVKEHLFTDNFKYCCPQIIGSKTPRHVCHAPSDGISSCEDLLDDVLKRSLLWLVAIISICLNIIVLTFRTVYERGVFKKGYGVFITNLGVSDFIMGVYLLIIAAVDVNFRDSYVLHETDWRHSILCKTAGFLSTLSSETSTFFVLLITLDRFLVIRFPFGEYRLTKWVLILSVIVSWVIGFILALIPVLYQQWKIYSSNAMCLGLPLTTSRQQGWQYTVGVFIVLNCILFICIALGQVSIFLSMSRKRVTSNIAHAARREQDITVAKQLFLIALSNFLCWFPICVIGLRSLNEYEASPDTFAWFVIFVLPLNAAVNPLIYTIPVLYTKWLQFKRGAPH